jgi:AcrR family transcriptional regulator
MLTYTKFMIGNKVPKVRRGDATRANILTAARERFAADGYERATIRAIAADANIDPALVMRYYGSKERLFAAAAEFDLRLPNLSALPREAVGAAFVEHFLVRWEEDDILKALLRTAATNERAAERMRLIFATQVSPAVAALCGDPKSESTRAGLISSQILGFALCRYVLRLPPVVAMRRADIVKWLGPTVQRYAFGAKPS